jgi:uncharacterized protein YecE (DUF72 family)
VEPGREALHDPHRPCRLVLQRLVGRGLPGAQAARISRSDLFSLADYFDTIELNVSFYRPLEANIAAGWAKKVAHNKRFRFTAKLWRGFTHERNAGVSDELAVKDGFAPLVEAGLLGAVLMQFPWSFRNTPENRVYVWRLRSRFSDYPMVLEVRHGSWNEPRVLELLEEMDLGLCNIDQPLFRRSIKALGERNIFYRLRPAPRPQLSKLVHREPAGGRAVRLLVFCG